MVTIPGAHSNFEIPEKYHEWAPKILTTADIGKEIEHLRNQIVHSTSKVSFCHNDMQEGNILLPKASSGNIRMPSIGGDESSASNSLSAFNPNDPRLVLIDFEYASYNYRGFDFANHFVEYSINYDVDEPPYYEIKPEKFPSKDRMFEFMLSYLKELNPNSEDDELEPQAHSMVEVRKKLYRFIQDFIIPFRKPCHLFQFHISFGVFGVFYKLKYHPLVLASPNMVVIDWVYILRIEIFLNNFNEVSLP